MFDNLSDKSERAFKVLKGQGKINEINVAETVKEIRKALLDADVNYKIAKDFTDTIKEKALGQNVLTAVSPGQLLTKIVHDELTLLMGGSKEDIELGGNPTVILMAGLQGSGKTTHSGKLALHLKTKRGKKPLLVAADVYRPAAMDQLKVLAGQIGVDCYFVTRTKHQASNPKSFNYEELNENVLNAFKLIVNCTPIGMFPNENNSPSLPYQFINSSHLLYDLVYNPSETEFLKKGKANGALTINGLSMLHQQAEEAWRIWNT